MMRCLPGYLSLALFLFLGTGCTKQCFLSKDDFESAHSAYRLMPANLENDPSVGVTPVTGVINAPPSVAQPERPPQYLTLQQAIAIALENGTVSERTGPGGTGLVNDTPFSYSGGSVSAQSDKIRVLAINPAVANTVMEESLARFDAQWVSGITTSNTDELLQGLTSFNNGIQSSFQSTIVKALSTGGVASMGFQTDYRNLSSPPTGAFTVFNPLYTSRVSFGIEQPLWRDFGTEINQLLNRFPSITGAAMPGTAAAAYNNKQIALGQGAAGFNITEGILIARLKLDAQRAEFERNVNSLILNVEVAYWKLYEAYGQLYSFEEVLRIAHLVWMNSQAQYKAGKINLIDFAPIRGQYEEFRGERVKALGAVLEAERNLRGIMGLPVEDGSRLVPVTSPTLAPFQPNWDAAIHDALALRPELLIARENVRVNQFNLMTMKNFLKPDLRAFAQYSPVGFGTRLDGHGTLIDATGTPRINNALASLASDHFNNWSMGLTLNVPLGFRLEHAAVRSARLNLAQSYEALKDQEERIKRSLTQQYQKLAEWYRRIETATAERKAYGEGVNAKVREIQYGGKVADLSFLDVNRRFALALAKEYEAIGEYNNSLTRFEWAKGTLLPFNNVTIGEGPLPECVQVRAVENERKRTHALVLRERPQPISHPGRLVGDLQGPPQVIGDNRAKDQANSAPATLEIPAEMEITPVSKAGTPESATIQSISNSPAITGSSLEGKKINDQAKSKPAIPVGRNAGSVSPAAKTEPAMLPPISGNQGPVNGQKNLDSFEQLPSTAVSTPVVVPAASTASPAESQEIQLPPPVVDGPASNGPSAPAPGISLPPGPPGTR